MAPPPSPPSAAALLWAMLGMTTIFYGVAGAQKGPSIPMKYCARVNTGNTFKAILSDFQSDGRCNQNCTSYAFAIVREKACWCSNLIPNPADQKPIDDCDIPCPGYPTDLCGGINLWGYMENVANEPTGTAPVGIGLPTSSAPTKTSSSSSSPVSTTVTSESSSSSTTNSSSSSSTTSSSSSAGITKEPQWTTITAEGTVKTVTVVPSATGSPNDAGLQKDSGNGLSGGAVAGIIVGVIGALMVLGAALWLMWRRRQERNGGGSELGFMGPSRRGGSATGSIAAMGSIKSGPHVSENRYLQRDPGWDENKRLSLVPPTDPRMKVGLYNRDNRSHDSMASLQDNQDYSRTIAAPTRVLRVTNLNADDD
ncbi:hypothetical protein QBC42DRAFT_99745 [Cladorrhinum samala]|uniref:WSC domain-containing protein n=1 Tax=Cladorrhinum samala TaxID=585594 RepID=A0AAV9HJR5_9PEZI|nr:hypothetical protein QBC42DRAFT_99745 [Cladorrhinum samala]